MIAAGSFMTFPTLRMFQESSHFLRSRDFKYSTISISSRTVIASLKSPIREFDPSLATLRLCGIMPTSSMPYATIPRWTIDPPSGIFPTRSGRGSMVFESKRWKYIFGPVPSRRLGRSLGVDTVPLKTCNWNCVYCQLGRTKPLVANRREWFPREEILEEVAAALDEPNRGEIDWITFIASGETTLHAGIGW